MSARKLFRNLFLVFYFLQIAVAVDNLAYLESLLRLAIYLLRLKETWTRSTTKRICWGSSCYAPLGGGHNQTASDSLVVHRHCRYPINFRSVPGTKTEIINAITKYEINH